MTPSIRIEVNGADVTARVRDRLISMRVSDEAGFVSDSLELIIDDRGRELAMPEQGAEIDLWLGIGLLGNWYQGKFKVDETGYSWPPLGLSIRAKGADMLTSLKAKKSRSWHEVSVNQIISTIAADHNLQPRVDEQLGGEIIEHIDQTEESDLHFATRLAKERDAVAKPVNRYFVFVPKGEAKSATGQPIDKHDVYLTGMISGDFLAAQRGRYKKVIAYWHDQDRGERREAPVGDGEPVKRIRHNYPNEELAFRAAEAEYRRLQRGKATLNLQLCGRPEIAAESRIIVHDFKPEIDGEWSVHRVEHSYDNSGLVTSLETEALKETEVR